MTVPAPNTPIRSAALRKFLRWLEPVSPAELESMAAEAQRITQLHFGKTMRLFAPLYVSNECVNNCSYCGFSRDNPILRVTLQVDEVEKEARHLTDLGFRNILLVAGEHPKFVSDHYLEDCIERLVPFVPSVALEVGPMETPEYRRMVRAGAEALVVYQETYDREVYAAMHTAGPKRDYDWRWECPMRAYEAGFRRIGIGALFGLHAWRAEAFGLASHLDWLLRHAWKAQFTVSLPRLRPAAGEFQPMATFTDRDYVQLVCALRLCFPQVGIVMSTREPMALRDAVFPLGITMMSAGSHTEPGGYTGQGKDDLHLTVRGRRQSCSVSSGELAGGQFEIADERSAAEVAAMLMSRGYEAVWKDWDRELSRVDAHE